MGCFSFCQKRKKKSNPKNDDPPHVVRDNKLTYIIWHDRRQVKVLTTIHNGTTYEKTVHSKFGTNHRRKLNHPKAVLHDAEFMGMGEVDASDQ